MKPTEHCYKCGVELNDDNWSIGRQDRGEKICRSCHGAWSGRNRVVIRRPDGSVRDIWRRDLSHQPDGTVVLRQYRGDNPGGIVHNTIDFEFPPAFTEKTTRLTRKRVPTPGYVYGLAHSAFPGLIKVGCSNNPKGRLSSAKTWLPEGNFEVYVSDAVDDYREMERRVHAKLNDRRVSGEWFRVDMELVEAVAVESMR